MHWRDEVYEIDKEVRNSLMKHFMVTYTKKDDPPAPSNIISSQWVEALSQEDVYGTLYMRLNVTKAEFKFNYAIVETVEIKEN
jgi:hypothetical protein